MRGQERERAVEGAAGGLGRQDELILVRQRRLVAGREKEGVDRDPLARSASANVTDCGASGSALPTVMNTGG